MSVRFLLFVAFLVALPVPALSQDFIDIDWTSMDSDTLLPHYERQIPLEKNFRQYAYSARIDYPELVPVTEREMSQWRLERYESEAAAWPEVTAEVGSSRGEGLLDVSFVPLTLRNGVWYRINSFKLAIVKKQVPVRLPAAQNTESRYKEKSVLESGRWYKIRVSESGVCRMTAEFLKKAGFNDPSKVRLYGYGGAVLPEQNIEKLTDDLEEIPLWRENGSLLFYAQGPLSWTCSSGTYSHKWNVYSRYGYYFITASDSVKPMEVPQIPVYDGRADTVTTTPDYALYEKDEFSWYRSGRTFSDDYDFASGPTRSYSFKVEDLYTPGPVSMDLSFSSNGVKISTVEVRVNGNPVGTLNIFGKDSNEEAVFAKSIFNCTGKMARGNTVQLYYKSQEGASGRLDYIRLNYTRNLVMHGSSMRFGTANVNNAVFKISSSENIVIWNVDGNGGISLVPSEMTDGYCVTSAVSCMAGSEFMAVDTRGNFPEPERVGVVENQNLHGIKSADMVIVVPSSDKLTAQAERLAEAHRKRDGMSVTVVRADMIYNEFSSGTPDATAYRRFLKMIYDRGEENDRLRYLLLFGDGAWDNRMVTMNWRSMSPDDYLLCYESENSVSEVSSYVAEDYYGLLEDGKGGNILKDKVDIGVGRFPVSNETDAATMVNKTISYMDGENSGDWLNSIMVLGDDGDNNLHMTQADRLAEKILQENPSLNVTKIYWDAYKMEVSAAGNTYPTVRDVIFKQLDYGALIVNYTGHGSPNVLSHEMVFGMNDFASLTSPRLPLWVTASCDITPFDNVGEMNGKMALLNKNGGALAMLTTTRTVYSNRNEKINNLYDSFVLQRENSLGDALRLTKVQLASGTDMTENKLHYVLLGDPALHLAIPGYNIVVDEVTTGKIQDSRPVAQACGMMRVSGHVDGTGDRAFNGLIYPKLYDSRDLIVTHNNQGADTAFWYYDYDRMLYSGSDSVRNGRFSFEIPIPKDINYSGEAGRLVMFAMADDGRTANGDFRDFLIGGTASSEQGDSIGPKLSVYLNYPDFPYWGKVNTTPCFVAELEDSSGINASGNGVGHDLVLQIDNDTKLSYVLNGYYSPAQGDFRRGRIVYQIPQLPAGKHKLQFRAWDIMNNSSTAELGFEVVEGASPVVRSVSLTENPVRERTSFVISHDRPGSMSMAKVEVFDANGRQLWTRSVSDDAGTGVCVIDWNVCSDSGQPLGHGMYMYKVTLSDKDGAVSQICGKFVVL